MKEMVTYLTFDGDCREAMTFYAKALGAEVHLMTFGDTQEVKTEGADRILHAKISTEAFTLMASDAMPGMPLQVGSNISISIDCESAEEQECLFEALGQGGTVTMPLQQTFWGAHFGMLEDRYKIQWMFNFDLPN